MTIGQLLKVANAEESLILDSIDIERIQASSKHVDDIVKAKKTVYGINTGFGPLCDTRISSEETRNLQHNLLMSHAVGVGNPIDPDLVKCMMIAKVAALKQGYSGIKLETVERLIWMVENSIIPVVPEKGSVGASGDLAPLAHMSLPLIGLGQVQYKGSIRETSDVLSELGIEPLQLGPKEGLALINGTQFMLAHGIMILKKWHDVLQLADVCGALSLEALMGSSAPFDERLHQIRPFSGSIFVASRLRKLLNGSEILIAHIDCDRVQDPYSLRCMPQVHGASWNAWLHLKEALDIELNSVTDNPIVLSSEESISGGNFHGQLIALPMDYAAFAVSELGNISDRRSYLLIEGRYNLPKLLIQNAGLHSGLMIPQYTTAALASENKTMCYPASADSIPTSLGQEDHVSMGSISGRKVLKILENVEYILAIELMYASQAIEFRRPLRSTLQLEKVYDLIRSKVPFINEDRELGKDIKQLHSLITEGTLTELINTFELSDGFEHFTIS
jgi:histidine ammonia-lyase